MTSPSRTELFDNLTTELSEEDGVEVTDEGLLVHGKLFVFLEEDDVVVEVPDARAADLKARGVAFSFTKDGHPSRDWVRVTDVELWSELAHEAHDFVCEPAVGRQS